MNRNKGKTKHLIIFGEVLFDNFPDGKSVLGGAPFNVAWSLNGFGRKPVFVSSVGSDANGAAIREQMEAWEMDCGGLQTDPAHLTGEVRVTIENDEPSYEICTDRAWDFIDDEKYAAEGLLYHGLLALRSPVSRATLQRMVERSPAQRFFDINLRPPYTDLDVLKKWLHQTGWLKLNIDELRHLLDDAGITLENCGEAIDQLRETYSIGNVVLTGGASGAVLHGDYGYVACLPAPQPDPFIDTVGAGDAFSAATIEGILLGLPAEEIVTTASHFAAKVCGLRGATTTNRSFYTAVY
ncbi:MAG: PfkB family carbohydrate kinase [Puniceicoccaceae bacterium]